MRSHVVSEIIVRQEGNVQSDTIIVVGAASRGIIQRGHESTAATYKTYYAPNPFDNITEEDVEEYTAEIQRKTGGTAAPGTVVTHSSSRYSSYVVSVCIECVIECGALA